MIDGVVDVVVVVPLRLPCSAVEVVVVLVLLSMMGGGREEDGMEVGAEVLVI